ncbi:hypothetical protein [Paracoccus sp. S1E-3]|uniref:hypothetical protein n=1 Tax=Paracoccus sp. S1E-3 TaxID=2756130 RepID=UPI0015EEA176|nr:hypothetical protein [Paracoccus sp. S1E-3]MBA4491992.1 hypothetical protein [Paracoccus sp. S1E-3]
MRQQAGHIGMVAGAAFAVLSGCASTSSDGGLSQPPRAKPATLPVQLEGPTEDTSILAGLSTKRGELMILENDGSVTTTKLDSPRGRQTLGQTGDEVYSLASVLVADDSMPVEALPKPPTAQDIALEKFAAKRGGLLPARITPTAPEAFLGGKVMAVGGGKTGPADLVMVQVRLQQGVDDSAAFAYATCTLAAWSTTTKTPFARHVRTVKSEDKSVQVVESVFTMSKTMPLGLAVMEREQTLRDCRAHGIPARMTAGPVEGTKKNG